MPPVGRMQLAAGAAGLTVAKVGEAEVMTEPRARPAASALPRVRGRRVAAAGRAWPRPPPHGGGGLVRGGRADGGGAGRCRHPSRGAVEMDVGLHRTGVESPAAACAARPRHRRPPWARASPASAASRATSGGPSADVARALADVEARLAEAVDLLDRAGSPRPGVGRLHAVDGHDPPDALGERAPGRHLRLPRPHGRLPSTGRSRSTTARFGSTPPSSRRRCPGTRSSTPARRCCPTPRSEDPGGEGRGAVSITLT